MAATQGDEGGGVRAVRWLGQTSRAGSVRKASGKKMEMQMLPQSLVVVVMLVVVILIVVVVACGPTIEPEALSFSTPLKR